MAVNSYPEHKNGIFYITFTCTRWLKLFQLTNSYDLIYNWFKILRKNNHQIIGFVIMPNHVHIIIHFQNNEKEIHKWISNGKRFMAYEIVERLKNSKRDDLLNQLAEEVNESDKMRGKKHQVFKDSFDIKQILTVDFLLQKLKYIHRNPVSKHWKLAENFTDYIHSSARYYENINFENSGVTPYWEIESLSLISTKRI